jgi:hypothetical protein
MYTGAVLATLSILAATVAAAQSESHTFFVTNRSVTIALSHAENEH